MVNQILKINILLFLPLFFTCCREFSQPKPRAMLRLKYPSPNYVKSSGHYPFNFEINNRAILKKTSKKAPDIFYPDLKATIYMSYIKVENNIDSLLNDAYKLTLKHMIKAEEIPERIFQSPNYRVYGTLYKIIGNAASQLQFFLTDSNKNFLIGSLYFYSKPNYDSIMPASEYIEKDVVHLMETFRWSEEYLK